MFRPWPLGADRSRPRRILRLPAGTVADLPGPPHVRRGRRCARRRRATRLMFSGPAELPFDHPDVRVYVDDLFLEGALRPDAASARARGRRAVGAGRRRDRSAGGPPAPVRPAAGVGRGLAARRRGAAPGLAGLRAPVGAGERAGLRRRRGRRRRGRTSAVRAHPRPDRRAVHRRGFAGTSRRCTICRP